MVTFWEKSNLDAARLLRDNVTQCKKGLPFFKHKIN